MTRAVASLTFVLVSLCGCSGTPPVGATGNQSTGRPSATSAPSIHRKWPLRHARSGPAEIGVAEPFRLYTHCGLDYDVDFDESFWKEIRHETTYDGLDNPMDLGTMTLVSAGHARYRGNTGGEVNFSRGGTAKRLSPCF
jgi:hypothetical protein